MPDSSPLDHPDLRAVDALLDKRQLEEAQRRLAALGQLQGLDIGTTYLVTRLLFLRGRLQPDDVADRLREILRTVKHFPEATYMLRAAESGVLTKTGAPPKPAEGQPSAAASVPPPEAPEEPVSSDAMRSPLPALSGPADALARPDASDLQTRVAGAAPEALGPRSVPPSIAPPPSAQDGPRIRSSFPASYVPPPREPPAKDSSVPPASKHDSLEVPRAPSWPPMPAVGERSRPLSSLSAFGSSHPPAAPQPRRAPINDSTPPTARSLEPKTPEEVDSKEAPLGSGHPESASARSEADDVRAMETEPGPAPDSPPTSRARSNEIATSVETATGKEVSDNAFVHVQQHGHVSTEPGVGEQGSGLAGGESMNTRLRKLMSPAIPRAPGIPNIAPPVDRTPSYVPRRRQSAEHQAPPEAIRKISTDLQAHEPEFQRISDLSPATVPREPDANPLETRYSEAPDRPEFVFSRAPVRKSRKAKGKAIREPDSPPPLPSEPPTRRKTPKPQRPTSDWPRAPRPRQQDAPSGTDHPASPVAHRPERPSLFEIATLLDQELYDDALAALRGVTTDAEHLLMKARALAGTGRQAAAIDAIGQLCESPLLGPELRAGAARLLIDLNRPDLAYVQAHIAQKAAPNTPLIRLTMGWAAIRELHRTGNRDLAHDADEALSELKGRGGPHPGLTQALRACVQAHVGDAERAIGVAQRALGLDPRSSEALAAITVASVRLQRVHDAQQAWLRLHELNSTEADALRSHLVDARIEIPKPGQRGRHGFAAEEDARTVWPALELQVLDADTRQAQRQFESTCRDRLDEVAKLGEDEGFPSIGNLAVHTLTEHPVWCHFAPFDLSLWSISRVRAALGLLYDPAERLREDADDFPVVLLIGAYLGQVLCQAYSAHWEGHITDLVEAQVVGVERCWSPFLIVADRLRDGTPIDFGIADDLKRAHPGADQWSAHVAPSVAPPSPWGPTPWPRPALVPRLGRALAYSAVSEWCRRSASGPLDGSVASLGALDAYLNLIAPPAARAHSSEPWLPRVSVLCGAYLGEVLRATVGGAWVTGVTGVGSPDDYQVRLGDQTVTPVAEVHSRITGRSTLSLLDYASKLTRTT